MDNVDTDRIKRVLERVYPPEEGEEPRYQLPPLPAPEPVETPRNGIPAGEEQPEEPSGPGLLVMEQEASRMLRVLTRKSRTCAQALGEALGRSGNRLQKLRTEQFLRTGETALSQGVSSRREQGVLSSLRAVYEQLRRLEAEYGAAARGDAGGGEMFAAMAAQCREDAEAVRRLLERLMR